MAEIESQLNVKIRRNVKIAVHPFTEYFKGFESVAAVREVFGEETEKVLGNLKVEFAGIRGYMGVSEVDGHLIMGARYLNEGDIVDIYLDIIHELVHVRQFMEGKELFDSDYAYIERPTEVEAYRHAVKEAKRLGMDDDRICEYLKTEWMSDDDLQRLARTVDVKLRTSAEDM
ncbi:MAG TPA: hypothetical protein VMT42_07235 [candidate division Zixibacteria bacterium]|nr:hypothetical protein [candidate division Zixibacteria bacterium]